METYRYLFLGTSELMLVCTERFMRVPIAFLVYRISRYISIATLRLISSFSTVPMATSLVSLLLKLMMFKWKLGVMERNSVLKDSSATDSSTVRPVPQAVLPVLQSATALLARVDPHWLTSSATPAQPDKSSFLWVNPALPVQIWHATNAILMATVLPATLRKTSECWTTLNAHLWKDTSKVVQVLPQNAPQSVLNAHQKRSVQAVLLATLPMVHCAVPVSLTAKLVMEMTTVSPVMET